MCGCDCWEPILILQYVVGRLTNYFLSMNEVILTEFRVLIALMLILMLKFLSFLELRSCKGLIVEFDV